MRSWGSLPAKSIQIFLLIGMLSGSIACQRPSPSHRRSFSASEQKIQSPRIPLDASDIDQVPILKVSPLSVDAGILPPDTVIRIPIMVWNEGDAPMRIVRAWSQCGCLVSTFPEKEILPGDVDTVYVELHTRELPEGAFRREVYIVANSVPNHQIVRIRGVVRGKSSEELHLPSLR